LKAVVLAAGDGTRLSPVTSYIPKSLLPLAGIPIVSIIVRKLLKTNIFAREDIIVVCMERYVKNFLHELRDIQGIQIVGTGENKGTATHFYHADKLALQNRNVPDIESTLVHYGDIYTTMDYSAFIQDWWNRRMPLTGMLAVTKDVRHDYSEVRMRKNLANGELILDKFVEKPRLTEPTWTGIAIFHRKKILKYIEKKIGGRADMAKSTYLEFAVDIIEPYIEHHKQEIAAHEFAGEWHDIGNLRAYQKLQERFITEQLII